MPASAAGFGQEFCSINQKIIEIDLSSQKKNVNKLFGFDKGLFILGDYSREQRLNAEKQASKSCGKEDYYSMENSNCEHFVNFCLHLRPFICLPLADALSVNALFGSIGKCAASIGKGFCC